MGLLIVLLWIWRWSTVTAACPTTEMGRLNSYSPFLVKIVETLGGPNGEFVTRGHGSLISPFRVISSCGPFNDYPLFPSGLRNPSNPVPHNITLIGVNTEDADCDQRKLGSSIILHPDCKNKDPNRYLVKFDFAIWYTGRWRIAEYAYTLVRQQPSPPGRYPLFDYYLDFPTGNWLKYSMMFMTLSGCESGKHCKFPVFEFYKQQKDKRLDHSRRKHDNTSLSYIQFIDWERCKKEFKSPLQTYKLYSTDAWKSDAFFCGLDTGPKPASDRESNQKGGIADWFSGAVVACRDGKPFGLASRHVEFTDQNQVKRFRVFVSFHHWDNITDWIAETQPFSLGSVNRGSVFITTFFILVFISQM